MKAAWMVVVLAAGVLSGQAIAADAPSGWDWDAPARTAEPRPLPAPPLHCAPRPGVALPPECARQAAPPDVENVEDVLKPPAVPDPSGGNRAKKVAR